MVGFERRRDKLGIYFTIDGVNRAPGKPQVFKHGFDVKYTEATRAQYEKDIGRKVSLLIDNRRWDELLALFPDNRQLRDSGLVVGARTTVGKLLDLNVAHWVKKEFRSLEDYQRKLKPIRDKWGETLASELTTMKLEAWKLELEAEGLADQTIKHRLTPLKLAFRLGLKKGLVTTAPVIDVPDIDNVEDEDAYFEDEEVAALLEHHPRHLKGVVKLAHKTGWRKTELLSRRKTDIQKDANGEFLYLDAEHSKNGEARWFPLNIPGVREVLDEQLAYVRELETRLGTIQEWLFPRPLYDTGSMAWSGREERGKLTGFYARGEGVPPMEDFEKVWATAVEKSGIETVDEDGEARPRHFRHFRNTAITNLLYLGVPPKMVSDLVGHKTIKMTVGRYAQKRKRRMVEVGERVRKAMAWNAVTSNVVEGNFQHTSNTAVLDDEEGSGDSRNPSKSGDYSGGQGVNRTLDTRIFSPLQR